MGKQLYYMWKCLCRYLRILRFTFWNENLLCIFCQFSKKLGKPHRKNTSWEHHASFRPDFSVADFHYPLYYAHVDPFLRWPLLSAFLGGCMEKDSGHDHGRTNSKHARMFPICLHLAIQIKSRSYREWLINHLYTWPSTWQSKLHLRRMIGQTLGAKNEWNPTREITVWLKGSNIGRHEWLIMLNSDQPFVINHYVDVRLSYLYSVF